MFEKPVPTSETGGSQFSGGWSFGLAVTSSWNQRNIEKPWLWPTIQLLVSPPFHGWSTMPNPGLQGWEKGLEKSKQLYMHHESQKSRLHTPNPLKAHAQLHLGQCSSIKKPSLECYLHILPQTNPSRLGVISWACVCHFAKKTQKPATSSLVEKFLTLGVFPELPKVDEFLNFWKFCDVSENVKS